MRLLSAPAVSAETLFTFLATSKDSATLLSLALVPLQGSPIQSPFPAAGVSYSPKYLAKGACQTHNQHLAFVQQYCYSTTQVVEAVEHSLYLALSRRHLQLHYCM